MWPSEHTLFGALALPGLVALGVIVAAPVSIERNAVRGLAIFALLCGTASYASQAVHDYRCHRISFILPDDFAGEIRLITDASSGLDLGASNYRLAVPRSGELRIRDDDFIFRCYSIEAYFQSGAIAQLEDQGVTAGTSDSTRVRIGPNIDGNIHTWRIEAR
jgi:hypothetical protein